MEIAIKSASKVIGKNRVLNDVSLNVKGGKIYGLKGPNGSGKTMLMRLISGLILPTAGEVIIDGRKLGKDMDFPSSVGLLIENPAFLNNYTGFRNLALLAEINHRISDKEIREALSDVGLDPDDKRRFRKYSLGMKQRLGIASAIIEKPELIILDEPMNALDNKGIEQIMQIITRERDRGALIVLSCHDNTILEVLSDEMYIVENGSVTKRG